GQVLETLAQLGDDTGAVQPEEGVEALFLRDRRDRRGGRVVARFVRQPVARGGVAGLSRQRELQVGLDVVVPWVDARAVRQGRQRQALLVIERVDRERLPGVRAGDQVVVVPVGVAGPDALDDQRVLRSCVV